MLDRWSILVHEKKTTHERLDLKEMVFKVQEFIIYHIGRILQSDKSSEIILSSKVVTSEINQLITHFKDNGKLSDIVLTKKLDSFISTLKHGLKNFDNLTKQDSNRSSGSTICSEVRVTRVLYRRKQILRRANSLKRALKQIFDLTRKVTLPSSTILKPTINNSILSELNDYKQSTDAPPLALEESSIASSSTISQPYIAQDESLISKSTLTKQRSCIPSISISIDSPQSSNCDETSFNSSSSLSSCIEKSLTMNNSEIESSYESSEDSGIQKNPSSTTHCARYSNYLSPYPCRPSRTYSPSAESRTPSPRISKKYSISMCNSNFLASSSTSQNVIGQALLASSDLCGALISLPSYENIPIEYFKEKVVMNNYFGIGLDAKVCLDFHLKREKHPEQCRSRLKNQMWFGWMGGREFLKRSCQNLEEHVILICDEIRIPLKNVH
ncbi:unnamed protein product, partial [Didymodactylos carnosus]